MRNRSQTWQSIVARNQFSMQAKLLIDGVEYTEISAPIIERSTGATPLEIGNVISSTLRVDVLASGQFEAGAEVVVMARIYDSQATSEWKKFGVYNIDKQPYDQISGLVSITAYDALKRTEQIYCEEQDPAGTWRKSFKAVIEEVAERIGVGIDPRVRIPEPIGLAYMVSDPYEKGRSIKDVLSGMAVCMGGNWVMSEEGLLRFIPLVSTPGLYRIIDRVGNSIVDRSGNTLKWLIPAPPGEEPEVDITTTVRPGTRPVSRIPIGGTDEEMGGTDAVVNVPVVLQQLSSNNAFTVNGVLLENEWTHFSNNYYKRDTSIPQIPIRGSSPYATVVVQSILHSTYRGLSGQPFDARGCIYDPCAELGDRVTIGAVSSVLVSETLTLGVAFRGDLSSPTSDALTSQYPYKGSYDHRPGGTYKPTEQNN